MADGTTDLQKFSLRRAREAKQQALSGVGKGPLSINNESSSSSPPNGKTVRFSPVVQRKEFVPELRNGCVHRPHRADDRDDDDGDDYLDNEILKNEEHLQLSIEEAFFLVYGLGALQIFDEKRQHVLPTTTLFSLFCQHAYFPPRDYTVTAKIEPDNPFLVSYVVYHHYRSLGWVVRSGVKFGVDYLLYNRGPVFSHAEFAVVVIPSYPHASWSEKAIEQQNRSWWWLHCVNRVQAQVKKTLVVCYVDIPPAAYTPHSDIGEQLRQYKVRDVSIRRWVPNRSRD